MWTGNCRIAAMGILLLGALASSACGGGSGSGGGNEPLSVTVILTPETAIVAKGHQQQFTAAVSGTSNTAVTWTVDGVTNGDSTVGTLSASGNSVVYTAPNSFGDHVMIATSVADTSKSASSKIYIEDVACALAPTSQEELIVTNAPYGAKGNDDTDDTKAIQKAVDEMVKKGVGGTVRIPKGIYLIDAAKNGILLGNNMTLRIDSDAVLKAIPNEVDNYSILLVKGVHDVNIVGGGTLLGERNEHGGVTGQWGHGLSISDSQYVVVENLKSADCWGDGFYIGRSSTHVTLCNVVADNNRRTGIAITSVDGLMIKNSIFRKTTGFNGYCGSGLNIEPNELEPNGRISDTVNNNVQILACIFEHNVLDGLAAGVPCSHTYGSVEGLVIAGNTVQNNGTNGIEISRCSGTQITGNIATRNTDDGILLRGCWPELTKGANLSRVSGNTVSDNGEAGILEGASNHNTIISNHGSGNKKWGIHSSHCTTSTISGNDIGLPVTYTSYTP